MHIVKRAVALTVVAVLAEVLIAWLVPGGETNAAAGLITLVLLAVPSAGWAWRDAKDDTRSWPLRSTWVTVGAVVAVLALVLAELHHPGDLVATAVGIGVVALIGVVLPSTVAGRAAQAER